ncbi:plasmodesmata-located protein 8 [Andrographis paniculata]|uniref:plasmodesmata-located protein 8 n=1 Tax=Andrographis paniculata TaxID=175694 RepID=UPI0021E8CBD0|nr:plasmodesmata-located protein 8 [Andrographis paniculata]
MSAIAAAIKFYTLFLFTVALLRIIHGGRANIFIYAGCSLDKFPPNSPYQSDLNALLSALSSSSSRSLYSSFSTGNATGLYQCRGDLKTRDCADCVAAAVSQLDLLCPYTGGAALQLDGCFLRYDDGGDFVGKLDTSLRYKKCSASNGGDAEFVRRRDDMLADLGGAAAAAAGFRVSSAGAVEGYAQCLGDLTAAECGECLAEGAAMVKSLCGAAVAGDVFLAKCYVRYWESGYYGSSSGRSSSEEDDVGKTVAIIVGVIAGLALLIVLLSLCRKSLG